MSSFIDMWEKHGAFPLLKSIFLALVSSLSTFGIGPQSSSINIVSSYNQEFKCVSSWPSHLFVDDDSELLRELNSS